MSRIKVLISRIKSMSIKRMLMMIKQIHKETGKNSLLIFVDMLFCAIKSNIGYQDYRVFGFAEIKSDKRKTFMTMNENLALTRMLNAQEARACYNDKTLFLNKFGKYTKRQWLDISGRQPSTLKAFCDDKESVFVKTPYSFGGQGIGEISITPYINYNALFDELMKSGQTLVEEKICQHEKMSSLHPDSINTIRIVTVLYNGEVHILSRILRMGQKGSVIDNITSGGIYAPVDEKGVITHPAFCDKTGESFSVHPTTRVYLLGFQVPYFDEAIKLVKEIALSEKNMGYVGWDVAITPDGPLIVEGNNLPSYEIMQNYKHRDNDEGLLPTVEKIIGKKL